MLQLEQFRQDLKQYIMIKFFGKQVGGGNVQEIDFIIPFKFTKFEVTSTPSMEFAEATIAGFGEYDAGIGGSYKVNWLNCLMPPNYSNS